jgi:hypothetical protein
MRPKGAAILAFVALAATALAAWVLLARAERGTRQAGAVNGGTRSALASHAPHPEHVRWLAAGGGVDPASNQVSIEQDLALVGRALRGGGVTLFAGGPGRSPVQLLDEQRASTGLHRRLGELFYPRDVRRVRYRPTTLALQGDGRAETVLGELVRALEEGSRAPLFFLVAAHGEPGKEPRDNLMRLWGGTPINAADLAGVVDTAKRPRPLVVLMSTCFSGGFAEIAFDRGDPERGATDADRCGLFATTWDTEAAGCDPNPDRREQESYFLHVMHALEGKDRDGEALAGLDLDGDGKISLSEAHARARVASRSISVPTSTSERWLRVAAPESGPEGDVALPEEDFVVRTLRAELELADDDAVAARRQELETRGKELDKAAEEGDRLLDIASAELRISLLERWPLLDDPYHADYPKLLEAEGDEIRRVLDRSDQALVFARASLEAAKASHAVDDLDVDFAMLVRLERALDNQLLAARLAKQGGAAYARFLRFLRCERAVPAAVE